MGGCDVQFDVFSFVVFVVALFFANKSIPLYICKLATLHLEYVKCPIFQPPHMQRIPHKFESVQKLY